MEELKLNSLHRRTTRLAISLVILFVMVLLLSPITQLRPSSQFHSAAPVLNAGGHPALIPSVLRPSVPTPMVGFPRTVLVETFTGVWCIHCPSESQAFHAIDETTSASVLNIAELHVCAFAPGSGPCLENYVPSDGTSNSRGVFYNVCGYPDVRFDGRQPQCGATDSETQMQGVYQRAIANASAIPGNVSITQVATISTTNVVAHASILSAINGSYNAITYLLEYIGKLNVSNGYGPHDVDRVVRATLYNHPVSLLAGSTASIDVTHGLNATWNVRKLSVITFVQENSSKKVENANMAPVTTLTTAVTSNLSTVISGTTASITVHVANSSTGAPVSGAQVALASDAGGSLTPSSGTTAADGSFIATFTSPTVTTSLAVQITASVTAASYTNGSGLTTLIVNARVLPLVPTGLTVSPGNQQVSLNWTAPSSGTVGVAYHVYRSTSPSGLFTEIGMSSLTAYLDTGLVGSQSYWYTVAAQNSGGYSPNTTSVPATEVAAAPQGLPPSVGWWISIGSARYSSTTDATLSLYFPSGLFGYTFGPTSYAYVAPVGSGTFTAAGLPLSIDASFLPRYASVQGTVSPGSATVLLNGTSLPLVNGAFQALLVAGVYSLHITAAGYQANSSTVVLTPGNLTVVPAVVLVSLSQPGGPAPASGLTNDQAVIVVGGVVALAALVGGAVVVASRSRRASTPRSGRKGTRPPPESPPSENEL